MDFFMKSCEWLGVWGNYVSCLVVVVILFIGLGGAKKWKWGDFKAIICGVQAAKEVEIVMEGVERSSYH